MKTRRDTASPWGRRVYFDDVEFERMMIELCGRVPGSTFEPGRGIDVDRVLMEGLGCEPDFVELPPGVLGRTRFTRDGRIEVEISRTLADEAETSVPARRRLRSTLGHECGHIACHLALVLPDTDTLDLFPSGSQPPPTPQLLCRNESVGDTRYGGEWWEYQANRCMSALLMPRRLVPQYLTEVLQNEGFDSMTLAIRGDAGRRVVTGISDVFDVNPVVAMLRLQELGFTPKEEQREMFAEA